MRASLSQKNNAVQPIPAPIRLLQVLFTDRLSSDHCLSVVRLRIKLKASYCITNLLNQLSHLVRTQAYIKTVDKSEIMHLTTVFLIGIAFFNCYSLLHRVQFLFLDPKHHSNNTFHLTSRINQNMLNCFISAKNNILEAFQDRYHI